MTIVAPAPDKFDLDVPILIIGAGTAGLVAALAAHECGADVLVVEAAEAPSGSTALSAGLIPAAGTRFQREAGIEDHADVFAHDIQTKAKHENPPYLVDLLTRQSAGVIEWLADKYKFPFSVVTNFDYPGHTNRRMHGLPSRSGQELIDSLRAAAENCGIDIICNRRATKIFAQDGCILGAELEAKNGTELIGCDALILACNGYGGNRHLVHTHMPEIENALWFGHDQNRGDAISWGSALGADMLHLGAYQGHGNVAHPHGILITWAVITQGGVQVNLDGERFWDESQGYSEAARSVLAQPEGVAWTIFDERIASIARQFQDFKDAEAVGAIKIAKDFQELSSITGLPAARLSETLRNIPQNETDQFGRKFGGMALAPPYHAVKVTGALFHTQGGLTIDQQARVKRKDGQVFPNLFATGGAAVGVSGSGDSGYLSGNGLLTASVLGHIAGTVASHDVTKKQPIERNQSNP